MCEGDGGLDGSGATYLGFTRLVNCHLALCGEEEENTSKADDLV